VPQELATVCGYIALVRCVLALRCGLARVVWYPYAHIEPEQYNT
jgi:hypothetical protein